MTSELTPAYTPEPNGVAERMGGYISQTQRGQIKDLDFHGVYAVVAKPMSFKTLTDIAASEGWLLHHVDIMAAFLYAELKEPIEIELPEG